MEHWEDRIADLRSSRVVEILMNVGQFTLFAVRRFIGERLNTAAASLTYSTLLAIVPLLVIAFAILSSFPAFDAVKGRMEALFFDAVVPEAGNAIAEYLSNFTQNASNLTAVGVVALAVTALLLLSTIEETLNRIWHVERPRPIVVRFLIFWAILTLGPLLIGASFTLTSDLTTLAGRIGLPEFGATPGSERFQDGLLVGTLLSVAISIIGFTALFVLVPARRVRLWHAAIGASFAAIAFEILSWGFNSFLTSGSSYETVYGAIAAVPVFLIWIYTSWTVIILGAVVAAAIPDWSIASTSSRTVKLSPAEKLAISVTLLATLHRQAQTGGTLGEEDLVEAAPLEARDEISETLHEAGYLARTEDGRVALARDLHTTTVFDLASDLGLSLGVAPERSDDLPDEVSERLASETFVIRELLAQLSEAEEKILDRPLAQVFPAPPDVEDAVSLNPAFRSVP